MSVALICFRTVLVQDKGSWAAEWSLSCGEHNSSVTLTLQNADKPGLSNKQGNLSKIWAYRLACGALTPRVLETYFWNFWGFLKTAGFSCESRFCGCFWFHLPHLWYLFGRAQIKLPNGGATAIVSPQPSSLINKWKIAQPLGGKNNKKQLLCEMTLGQKKCEGVENIWCCDCCGTGSR